MCPTQTNMSYKNSVSVIYPTHTWHFPKNTTNFKRKEHAADYDTKMNTCENLTQKITQHLQKCGFTKPKSRKLYCVSIFPENILLV